MKGAIQSAALAGLVFSIAAQEAEYPIACWTYMRFEEQTRPMKQVVKDWKELGITHPLMPVTNEKSDKAAVHKMLDLCAAAGLHPLMTDERVDNPAIHRIKCPADLNRYRKGVQSALADWGSHPAVSGFYLYDEPDSNIVSAVTDAARVCREEDPSKIWYINLLPWYEWIGPRLGCNDYAVYLDRVVEASTLPSMGYDFYEHQNEINGLERGTDLYFTNLRQWMELSIRRRGFRFNVTQLCMNLHNYRIKSQDDFRWQISTAAAMGAKGLNWFYPDMSSAVQGCTQNYRNAPINMFGERTQTYEWMSTENRLFQRQYGSEFMRFEIESAAMTLKPRGGLKLFEGDKDVVKVESPEPVLVSFFHDADGVRYMAAVNLAREISYHVNFTFAPGVTPCQRAFTRKYVTLATSADPVTEHDTGGRVPHRAGRYLAPGQLLLVKLAKNEPN
jgi:hypothetical protein